MPRACLDGLRVALVTDTFHPTQNGVVRSVDNLAASLRALGARATIFAPGERAARRDGTEDLRLVPAIELNLYPELRIALLPLTPREMSAYDVVHVHTPGTLGLSAALSARRTGARLVYTYHTRYHEAIDHFAPRATRPLAKLADRSIHAWIARHAHLIAPTEPIARELARSYGARAAVIPTGLDPGFAAQAALERKAPRLLHAPTFLYLGRLAPEKNIELVLDAFALLQVKRSAARLRLAGTGPHEAKLRARADALGITDQVEWLGHVPERNLAHTYAEADVFVTASNFETQGLTLLEALACGCRVVCPDLPVFGYATRPGAATPFAPDDATSLSRAMLHAAEAYPRSSRPTRRILEEHSAERILDAIAETYGAFP